MKYKGSLRGKFFKAVGFDGFVIIVVLVLAAITTVVVYQKEDHVTATVPASK